LSKLFEKGGYKMISQILQQTIRGFFDIIGCPSSTIPTYTFTFKGTGTQDLIWLKVVSLDRS